MMTWLVNGDPAGQLLPDDRGLAYGDGLFETIALRHGAPRFLPQHVARMRNGCRQLGITPPTEAEINGQVARLTAGCQQGSLKVIRTRGRGPRGYAPGLATQPTLVIGLAPDSHRRPRLSHPRWMLTVCSVPASVNAGLAGMKTLNRLDNVLARRECVRLGADEGLMLTPSGDVIGGTMSNVFIVTGGQLVTPWLGEAGIHGIMRGMALKAARRLGIVAREERINVGQVRGASEVFVTNSLIGMRPAAFPETPPGPTGPVTRALAAELATLGVEECEP